MLNNKHQAKILACLLKALKSFHSSCRSRRSMSVEGRCFRCELKCDGDVRIRLRAARVITNVFAAESVDHLIGAIFIVIAPVDSGIGSLDYIHIKSVVRPGTEPVRSSINSINQSIGLYLANCAKILNSFFSRLLSSCTDKYAHTYDISTYWVSSNRAS